MQTKLHVPYKMTIRLQSMRSIMFILSNVLRSWSVLLSGL
jgi:hypothetical protein